MHTWLLVQAMDMLDHSVSQLQTRTIATPVSFKSYAKEGDAAVKNMEGTEVIQYYCIHVIDELPPPG